MGDDRKQLNSAGTDPGAKALARAFRVAEEFARLKAERARARARIRRRPRLIDGARRARVAPNPMTLEKRESDRATT